MYFREALKSDYEAICRLVPTQEELFRVYPRGTHPLTVEQIHQLAEVRKELTVATDGTHIMGFANLYDVEPPQKGFIGNVVIDKAFRGAGLGEKLVRHMRDAGFVKYGLQEIHISVFNDNTVALLLYSKLGFIPYAIEQRLRPDNQKAALVHMKIVAGSS